MGASRNSPTSNQSDAARAFKFPEWTGKWIPTIFADEFPPGRDKSLTELKAIFALNPNARLIWDEVSHLRSSLPNFRKLATKNNRELLDFFQKNGDAIAGRGDEKHVAAMRTLLLEPAQKSLAGRMADEQKLADVETELDNFM